MKSFYRKLNISFLTIACAVVGVGFEQEALANKDKPTEIKVYPNPALTGDGSKWKVTVTTSYVGTDNSVKTKPAFEMEVKSGECAKGKSRTLDMRGDFKVIVVDQMCIGLVNGKTDMAGWLTSDYPSDVLNKLNQSGEEKFVYGEGFHSTMDKQSTYLQAEAGVFRVVFQKIN